MFGTKKFIAAILIITSLASPLFSDALSEHQRYSDALYRQGAGAQDGGYTAISLSMFGWGIGLAAGIALLAALFHQSTASGAHNHNVTCH